MANGPAHWLSLGKGKFITILSLFILVVAMFVTIFLIPRVRAAGYCQVTYTVTNQWTGNPGGFTVQGIDIQNTSGSAWTNWTLTFTFPAAGQAVQPNPWNGTFSQSGQNVTITNVSYNGNVAVNTSVNPAPGFNGNWTTSNPTPTNFAVNGQPCNGTGNPTPTPSPTPTMGVMPQATMVAHTATQHVAANVTATVTASCAAGEVLLSGGYFANVFESVSVQASYPSASNAWTVIASSAPSSMDLTTYADCVQANVPISTQIFQATGAPPNFPPCPPGPAETGVGFNRSTNLTYSICGITHLQGEPSVSVTAPLPSGIGNSGSAAAACPASQLLTGGFVTSNGGVVYSNNPAPNFTQWQGAADTSTFNGGGQITTTAFCAAVR
jgi:hypothetical protein